MVIRHVVMWKLYDFAGVTGNRNTMDALQKCIAAMRTDVAGLLRIDMGVDKSRTPDSADLVLFSEFSSWAELDAYQGHPLHDEFRKLLGPLRSERRLGDYEI